MCVCYCNFFTVPDVHDDHDDDDEENDGKRE